MNWYEYLPPLFGLYLIAIGFFVDLYIDSAYDSKADYAKDAIARVEFSNSFVMSIIELLVIFSKPQAYSALTLTVCALVLLFFPMMYWVNAKKPPRLAAGLNRRGWKNSTMCSAFLIIVHLLIITAITIAQRAEVTSTHTPAAASSGQSDHAQTR